MKNRPKLTITLTVLLLVSVGCGPIIPTASPTLPFVSPDLTLTAIFSALVTPATPTSPVIASNTPLPATNTPTESLYVTPNVETLAPVLTSVAQTEVAQVTDTPLPSLTSTSKPLPTKTSSPAPTITPTPPSRSGPMIYAAYLSPAPNIDGSLGDWEGDWTTANNVVYGKEKRQDAADLSARFKIGWDRSNLYLAVQVTDDTYVQEASKEEIFLGDSLEVLLDINLAADFKSEALSSDDYQLGISGQDLVKDDGEAYLWYPEGSAGSKSKVVIQARPTDEGYRVEVAIPWSVLGMTPVSGMHYGFVFSVSDNDNPGSKEQHSMISNVEERELTDPTTWGNLILRP